jgi:hypothetical protein
LNEFAVDQHRREAGIHGVEIPFGLEEDFAEEREVGFRGVDACNRALQILSSYDPEVTGQHLLLEALHMFNNGMCGVKEAMKINRRSYGRPLWL